MKPVNGVHSGNAVNSENSGSDKINPNLVRLYAVVGVPVNPFIGGIVVQTFTKFPLCQT